MAIWIIITSVGAIVSLLNTALSGLLLAHTRRLDLSRIDPEINKLAGEISRSMSRGR